MHIIRSLAAGLAALVLTAMPLTAQADGLINRSATSLGLCYGSGSSGALVPCVLAGNTWTRVYKPGDDANFNSLTAGALFGDGTALGVAPGASAPAGSVGAELNARLPVRTLESYGGQPGSCATASASKIAFNIVALQVWLSDVTANPASPPALSFNAKIFCTGQNAITFAADNLNMRGGSGTRSADSRNGGLSSTLTSGTAYTFTGYAPLLDGVLLQGPGRTSGLTATAAFNGLPAGDLDARLIESQITGAATAVVVRGRGFEMGGGTLFDAGVGADLGMPATLATPTTYTNTREGGSRVYRFNGVRFHSITGNDVQNLDPTNGPYLFGIQITDCYHDTLGVLFRGYLNHGLIANNIHFFGNNAFVRLLASTDSIITGNTAGGGPMTPSEFTAAYPGIALGPQNTTNAIRLDGPTTNLTISNNKFQFIDQIPFYITGGNIHHNLTIRDNSLYRTMLGNATRTDYPVQIDAGATLNGFTFTGNRGFFDSLTNMGSAGWIYNSGTINGFKFADNRENGVLSARQINNLGTLSYLRDHQPRDAYTVVNANSDITAVVTTYGEHIRHTGTLTADRALNLSATNTFPGARFIITRTGSGAFNLNVGTGPLKALAQNQWCIVVYDGTAWYLAGFGSL